MNRILLLILLSPVFTFSLFGQQIRFDEANELLENQQVEDALEIYRDIENDGYISGKLYYNMGLSSIYRDSLGLARYYFMKSTGFPDTRQEALEALDYVNSQFNRRSSVLPKLPWTRFFDWLSASVGPAGLMALGLILFNLGIAGIITSWFTNRFSGITGKAGIWVITGALFIISISLYIEYLDNRYDTGVMINSQTTVREQPRDDSASISTAYEGYSMTVDQKRSESAGDWYYVRLENGMYGWIESNQIRIF